MKDGRLCLTVLALTLCSFQSCVAQDSFDEYRKQQRQNFDKYRILRQREFEEYRRKRNEEFAEYMRKAWEGVKPTPVITKPKEEPVPPAPAPEEETVPVAPPKPLPFDEVVPAPTPQPQPTPVNPIEEVPAPTPKVVPTKNFTFYGTEDNVRFDAKSAIRLGTLNENVIADAWLKLSGEEYTNLIHDCLRIREERALCDWAYLQMLQQMSESVCGKGTNEAVLLMAYVYCQSGYKMRLGMNDNKLYMLFASKHIIYNWNCYTIDGEMYYTFNNRTGSIRVCNQRYPKEQSMSLLVSREQKFAMDATAKSTYQSKKHGDMAVSVSANRNMLDFYTSYPTSMVGDNFVTRWAMYANMPMPNYVRKQIYPTLRSSISDCTQVEAVTKILNLIQTGFEYEYDDKVWGDDRAFFPEESLHYPYCDCEDRSILLTRLVRDLLGLKCILIYYPGHLAAAVEFTQGSPSGDYIELNGHKFFITDGTILNGTAVGRTMSGMDNRVAKVILLD